MLEKKDFELPQDFLKNLQIGKASKFAGELSELNIWSKALAYDEIKDLYDCKDISEKQDVLNLNDDRFGS